MTIPLIKTHNEAVKDDDWMRRAFARQLKLPVHCSWEAIYEEIRSLQYRIQQLERNRGGADN